jgi:ATP-dependent RNA helicase DeaD
MIDSPSMSEPVRPEPAADELSSDVEPSSAPPPADPLAALPEALQKSLARKGYLQLTTIQLAASQSQARGRNLRLTSQTGSGKTVALGIAVYDSVLPQPEQTPPRGPSVLIVAPTRELASQIQGELGWLYAEVPGCRVEVVTGGTDVRAEQQRLKRVPRVLVGTPGRLLDHVRSGKLLLSEVQEVVLDEADQMLDLGFKDELDALLEQLPPSRRSHLVSATFPRAVQQLAERFQNDALHLQGSQLGAANHDIRHVAHLIAEHDRYAALVNVLLAHRGSRCLVFVQRRVDAAEVSERLAADGFAALPISGDLPQAQRNRTLASFKAGVIEVLVATDVAARGIHVDDIALVIHGDMPKEPDVYTHRSGRTGRAGQTGKSILFVTPSSRVRAERLLQKTRTRPEWEPLPTAKRIQQTVVKQMRRSFHALLPTVELDASELEYAKGLLTQHDPAKVIGLLLRLATPKLPCAPMPVTELVLRPPPQEEAAPARRPRPGAYDSAEFGRRRPGSPPRETGPAPRGTGAPSQGAGSRAAAPRGAVPSRGAAPRGAAFRGAPGRSTTAGAAAGGKAPPRAKKRPAHA